MRISDWSSDVCSSDLQREERNAELDGAGDAAAHRLRALAVPQSARQAAGVRPAPVAVHDDGDVARRCRIQGNACVVHCLLRPELAESERVLRHITDPRPGGSPPPSEPGPRRSEEHTSELQSLMRISYAVFCLKKNTQTQNTHI